MKSVYEFLENLKISKSETLIVAVSYGPDSMALLDIINKVYSNNKIVCAHVHHNHRKESDLESVKLKDYCKRKGICFEFMKIDSYNGNKFTEQEARKRRYDFFELLIKKYGSNYLFTAHHGDDLIETILMRITRGSTLKGYAGISLLSKHKGFNLVRPFLLVTKNELLNYCDENKIPYAVDKSNFDDKYTRNRYRKYVVPYLKQENPLVHKQFLKFSTILCEYDEYFEKIIDDVYPEVVIANEMKIDKLLKYDDLIIKRIIARYLFNNYGDDVIYLSNNNTDLILSLIKGKNPNGKLSLPNKKKLVRTYNKIYFDNDLKYNGYCFVFNDYEELPNGFKIKQINKLENTSNYVTAFNSGDISFPLYVRSFINGDKVEVLGLGGSKKIHDIFINEKIPKQDRNTYPLLVDSKGNIIWVPGLKKSKYDKSKSGKYDIILKYYKEEEHDKSK